jgi:hypothetical protein
MMTEEAKDRAVQLLEKESDDNPWPPREDDERLRSRIYHFGLGWREGADTQCPATSEHPDYVKGYEMARSAHDAALDKWAAENNMSVRREVHRIWE